LERHEEEYDRRGYQYFGSFVGATGDVDADGTCDLVVGDAGPPCHYLPVALWILSGRDGSTLRFIRLPPPPSGQIDYPDIEIAGGADLDGDHILDLVVGERGQGHGAIFVVSGNTGMVLRTIDVNCAGWSSTGWIRLLADRDSDGVPEIGVLCPLGGGGPSVLKILSGRTGAQCAELEFENETRSPIASFVECAPRGADKPGPIAFLVDVCLDESIPPGSAPPRRPPATLRFVSPSGRRELSRQELHSSSFAANASIEFVGDTDGDGCPELLLAHGESVDLFNCKTGELHQHYAPFDTGIGCSLAAPGDLDRDGVPDIVMGEYDPGLYEGAVIARSGKTGALLWEVHGLDGDDVHHLGYRLAISGDIDGDGASDLVVGTMEGPDGVARGVALVLSGRSGQRLFQFRRRLDSVDVEFSRARDVPRR
jgi:hypothetical protein